MTIEINQKIVGYSVNKANNNKSKYDLSKLNWQSLVKDLGLTGLNQQLAMNCSLNRVEQNILYLTLEEGQRLLFNKERENRIEQALKTLLSEEVNIKITINNSVSADSANNNNTNTAYQPKSMHENIQRPEVLIGSTYKIKTPLSDHALYVTINDIELEGKRYPFEIFVNSKNMENFQWIVALTRIMSSLFRKGGDIAFLVEDLHAVFDPRGGYFKKGGKYMPSLVAELGDVVETHLQSIGIIPQIKPCKANKLLKDTQFDGKLCVKCHSNSVVITNGCSTCLNCGESKCE